MSKSIYFELGFLLLMVAIIRDIQGLYIVVTVLLAYSYLKRYLDKKEILKVAENWKRYIKKEKYVLEEKKFTSNKVKRLVDLFRKTSEMEKEKAIEVYVASERLDALKDQLKKVVDRTQLNVEEFLTDINTGIKMNNEIQGELSDFTDEFESLRDINKVNTEEIENILDENIKRKEKVNTNLALIDEGLAGIEQLGNKVGGLEKHAPKLEKSLDEVSKIVGIVEKVVKKTELLSLNASVEASRAGEAGRGFAVVANEIISLANESRGAISEIEKNINYLSKELKSIVEGIKDSKVEVDRVGHNTLTIKNSINNLEGEFDKIENNIKDIELNSDREKEIFERVDKNLSSLKGTALASQEAFDEIGEGIAKQKRDLKLLTGVTGDLDKAAEDIRNLNDNFEFDFLKKDDEMTEIIDDEKEYLNNFIKELSIEDVDKIRDYMDKRGRVEAVWITDTDGNFLLSIPQAGINNGRGRSWFKESMKKGAFESDIYISAISKKPCLTLSKTILNGGGKGKVEGVLGIDLSV